MNSSIISGLSRLMGISYGAMSILLFHDIENLNLWITSGYIASYITLSSTLFDFNTDPKQFKLETLKSKKIFKFSFAETSTKLAICIHLGNCGIILIAQDSDSISKALVVVISQTLSLPFLLRIRHRSTVSLLSLGRLHYIYSSLYANSLSLLFVIVVFARGQSIDATNRAFYIFLLYQLVVIVSQDYFDNWLVNNKKWRKPSIVQSASKKITMKSSILMSSFLIFPIGTSIVLMMIDGNSSAISNAFVGLNIMVTVLYIFLPHTFDSSLRGNYFLTIEIAKKITLKLFFFLAVFLIFGLIVIESFQGFFDNSWFINNLNYGFFVCMFLTGIFMLPIYLLENVAALDIDLKFMKLNATSTIFGITIVLFSLVLRIEFLQSMVFSYVLSFSWWYTQLNLQKAKYLD